MRWLFLLLLGLNLAYVGWELSRHHDDRSAAGRPRAEDVAGITLLSELPARQSDAAAAEVSAAEGMASAEQADAAPAGNDAGGGRPAGEDAPSEAAPADTAVAQAAGDKAGSVSAQATAPPERCYTLGPFRDRARLASVKADIAPFVRQAGSRALEEKEQSLFWVYIPPQKNRQAAIRVGKRLKKKKIKDFYIIREGDKNNGVSLGHFRNRDGANRLAKRVRKKGFKVVVEPIFKTYTLYWLDYRLPRGHVIPPELEQAYLSDKIRRLPRDCGES